MKPLVSIYKLFGAKTSAPCGGGEGGGNVDFFGASVNPGRIAAFLSNSILMLI